MMELRQIMGALILSSLVLVLAVCTMRELGYEWSEIRRALITMGGVLGMAAYGFYLLAGGD